MPNARVPAAATGLPAETQQPSRRLFLAAGTAATVFTSVTGAAKAAGLEQTDPVFTALATFSEAKHTWLQKQAEQEDLEKRHPKIWERPIIDLKMPASYSNDKLETLYATARADDPRQIDGMFDLLARHGFPQEEHRARFHAELAGAMDQKVRQREEIGLFRAEGLADLAWKGFKDAEEALLRTVTPRLARGRATLRAAAPRRDVTAGFFWLNIAMQH